MSFWQEHQVETKVLDILRDVLPLPTDRGRARPFLSAYQVAIEFASRHPQVLEAAGWAVGGAGSGQGYSLAQYLASNLARYVREHPGGSIEQVFFSNQQVNDLSFVCGEQVIHSSVTATSPTLALYRLRETGTASTSAPPLPAQTHEPALPTRVAPGARTPESGRQVTVPIITPTTSTRRQAGMGDDITKLSVADWQKRLADSNNSAMQKRHQYPPREGAFLWHCCLYQAPTCSTGCFCQSHGNDGVWTLRPDLDFDTFLQFYGELWIGVQRASFVAAVHDGRRETQAHWATGVRLLCAVKRRWSDWDGKGHSLPELASRVRRCFLCDDAFDLISPFVDEIRGLCEDGSDVYTAKLISQIFMTSRFRSTRVRRGCKSAPATGPGVMAAACCSGTCKDGWWHTTWVLVSFAGWMMRQCDTGKPMNGLREI